MDKLQDLPVSKHPPTPGEQQAIDRYFPEDDSFDSPKKPKDKFIVIIIMIATFALLCNPWLDSIIASVPSLENNSLVVWGVRVALFGAVAIYFLYFKA